MTYRFFFICISATKFKSYLTVERKSPTIIIGDTWFEYGVGGTFRITPNWNAAVDLSRTTGGEVESNWIANVSMRYVW